MSSGEHQLTLNTKEQCCKKRIKQLKRIKNIIYSGEHGSRYFYKGVASLFYVSGLFSWTDRGLFSKGTSNKFLKRMAILSNFLRTFL